MNELSIIEMNDAGERWVSGRKLHALLRCATRYAMWFPRMCEFGFVENTDFRTFPKTVKRADGTEMPRCEIDHMLTVEMAKEICMLQRTEIGRKIRQYFIAAEAAWNSPEAVLSRAMQVLQQKQATLDQQMQALTQSLEAKTALVSEMEPKAAYYDMVLSCKKAVPITLIAKDYGWSAQQMNAWLKEKRVQYRMGGSWVLYQEIADRGYTKSVTHSHRDPLEVVHTEIRLRWTQKGRLFIYELMKKAGNLPLCERDQEDKKDV